LGIGHGLCHLHGALRSTPTPFDPMRIVTFIPSRFESTRFLGKPLQDILGKPLIQHVYERAKGCAEVSEVYVATDDERIFQRVREFGGKAVMTDRKHPTGTDRVAEAAQKVNLDKDDLVINVQGDQPNFHPSQIGDLIGPFKEDSSIPMSTLKYRIRDETEIDDPNYVKVVTDKDGFALFFSRMPIPSYFRWESHKSYYKHHGMYAYRRDFLAKFNSLPVGELESSEKVEALRAIEHGYRIKVVETPFDSIEIDRPGDIKRAEELMAQSDTSPGRITRDK
jgi:3-deoxy-manno-octulosonate cytidylyltransferase (CMP-KDO synthetase)